MHFRNILSFIDDLLVLVAVLTLWTCARSFSIFVNSITQELERDEYLTSLEFHAYWEKVDEYYKALQRLASLVNKTFGYLYASFMIDDVLYYSTSFTEVFIQQRQYDYSSNIRVLFFFTNTAASLVLSANIVRQVGRLHDFLHLCKPALPKQGNGKGWRIQEKCNMPFEHMQVYWHELQCNSVAIKAANIFPVTYTLVANVSDQVKGQINTLC